MTAGSPHTVIFEPAALADLARAWTVAADRNAVTAAVEEAEFRLRRDPYRIGREVSEGLRACDISPVSVSYEVSDETRTVTVTAVRLLMPPKSGNGRPPTRKV